MSGPFHERAICACGWSGRCSFGNLAHLTFQGQFINHCPDCGASKGKMEVRVLRWNQGTWRDTEGKPFDGKEPTPEEARSANRQRAGCILTLLLAFCVFLYLVWDHI
jgi:hypothetical protein